MLKISLHFVLRLLIPEEPTVTNCFYPLVKLMQGISVLAIGSFVCGTVFQTVLILIHLALLRDRLLVKF